MDKKDYQHEYYLAVTKKKRAERRAKRKPFTKVCVICGKEFNTFKKDKVTCSNICQTKLCYRNNKSVVLEQRKKYEKDTRALAYLYIDKYGIPEQLKSNNTPILKTCVVCGKKFMTDKVTNYTCSSECEKVFTESIEVGVYTRVCPICNKKFTTTKKFAITCGDDKCVDKYKAESTRSYQTRHKKERNERLKLYRLMAKEYIRLENDYYIENPNEQHLI